MSIAKIVHMLKEKWLALSVMLSMFILMSPAHADYGNVVAEVKDEFDEGEKVVGGVFGATIEIYVIRRVWRIIRSSI